MLCGITDELLYASDTTIIQMGDSQFNCDITDEYNIKLSSLDENIIIVVIYIY